MTITISEPIELCHYGFLLEFINVMYRVEQDAGTIPHRRRMPEDDDYCIFAGNMAAPMGIATFAHVGQKRMHLDLLIVRQAYRRAGIATALFQAVKDVAKKDGCEVLVLGTLADNAAMQTFLARQNCGAPNVLSYEVAVTP